MSGHLKGRPTSGSGSSGSTRAASVLIIVLLLIPVLIAGFVDDARLGGLFGGTVQTVSVVDWEDTAQLQVASCWDAPNVVCKVLSPLGTNNATVDIQGESIAATTDVDGFATGGLEAEKVVFAMAVARDDFIGADPTGIVVNWSRDDVDSGIVSDIRVVWRVCSTDNISACSETAGAVDSHQIAVGALVFVDPSGTVSFDITLSDLITIGNLLAVPTNGNEFISVEFLDRVIVEGTLVVMDAQVTGPQGVTTISLDTFGLILGLYSIFILIPAAIIMLDSVTLEGVLGRMGQRRRGGRRGVQNMRPALAGLAGTLGVSLILADFASAGTLNTSGGGSAFAGLSLTFTGLSILVAASFVAGIAGGKSLRWLIGVGLVLGVVVALFTAQFQGFFDTVINAGIGVLAGTAPATTFNLAAVTYLAALVLIAIVATLNLIKHRTFWA